MTRGKAWKKDMEGGRDRKKEGEVRKMTCEEGGRNKGMGRRDGWMEGKRGRIRLKGGGKHFEVKE